MIKAVEREMRLATLTAGLAATCCLVSAAGCGQSAGVGASTSPNPLRVVFAGRSSQGRPITARAVGSSASGNPAVLVIGCIDGDEPAGIEVVRRLEALAPPPGSALWVLADLNPDGVRAQTRQNANGVDLNRNFPFGWQALGGPGNPEYSGAHALSEPESRFAYRLILRLQPRVTIWFHQPLGLVDGSEGDPALVRRFADLAGLPLVRLPRYPGSAAAWQNHDLRGTTAFVVELPRGRPSASEVNRWAGAVEGVAGLLSQTRWERRHQG